MSSLNNNRLTNVARTYWLTINHVCCGADQVDLDCLTITALRSLIALTFIPHIRRVGRQHGASDGDWSGVPGFVGNEGQSTGIRTDAFLAAHHGQRKRRLLSLFCVA